VSADSCVVLYGLAFELRDEEIEACELRTASRMLDSRDAGLHHYWGAFGIDCERYLLFVGLLLGVFGPEHVLEKQFSSDSLRADFVATEQRLKEGGFAGECKLFIEYAIDH